MNGDHVAHLDRIVSRVSRRLNEKYRIGQSIHGGELWRKPGMVAHAEMELLDLITYHYTLAEQLQTVLELLERGHPNEAEDGLRAILKPNPKD